MATEIELKYLVVDNGVADKITAFLDEQKLAYSVAQHMLTNCYFDTKDLAFRQHDFGLRVRSKNNQREQTIKTAGQVIGGLHKRPEYNVDITDNFPNLALFPTDIWPEHISVEQWQADLIVLFSTDFNRHTWTIEYQNSVIELAFDVGSISSSGESEALCEIELELLSGDESAIFSLAAQLMQILLMRPGTQSKAARGYRLWHQSQIAAPEAFPFVPLTGAMTLSQGFIEGMSFSLAHLQKVIDYYFTSPSLSKLSQINHALLLIRHGFWVFEPLLDEQAKLIRKELSHFLTLLAWQNNALNLQDIIHKSSKYRKKIEYNQQLVSQLKLEKRRFPNQEQVLELLQSARFNQLQLSLLQLILKGEGALAHTRNDELSMFKFCALTLENSLVDLIEDMPADDALSADQYLAQKRIINRSLLTGSWCAKLYDDKNRAEYRAPWLDILHGITELETLTMLRQQLIQLQAIEPQSDKLLNWLDSKIDNLLIAMNASRNMATQLPPYWRH